MKNKLIILLVCVFIQSLNAKAMQADDLLTHAKRTFPSEQSKATVVVFLSAKCPCSASHEPTLKKLYEEFKNDQIEFVAIHSNQNETSEESVAHFKQIALPFAVLEDKGAKIADELKALKTPHVFIFQKGKIIFQGGVDDSADSANAKKHFLQDALTAIKNNKPIEVGQARALGCVIKR